MELSYGYPLAVLLGYLLGSVSLALIISKLKGVDLRKGGSGNLGASNTVTLMGWKAGLLVGLHDIGKGLLAVVLARALFPGLPYVGVLAGVSCVLGHIYPFYLRFRGGKSLAAYIGMIVALNWRVALVILALFLAVVLLTDYIVAGTMTTIVSFPAWCVISGHYIMALLLCIATGVIIYKHRSNLVRIANGTEIKVRAASRGEHRAK